MVSTTRAPARLSPSSAEGALECSVMLSAMFGLNIVKTPPRWLGFCSCTPSSENSVSSAAPPRTLNVAKKSPSPVTPGSCCTARPTSPMAPGASSTSRFVISHVPMTAPWGGRRGARSTSRQRLRPMTIDSFPGSVGTSTASKVRRSSLPTSRTCTARS